MPGSTNVIFCGFGGQGIVLIGSILGYAAVYEGLNVAQATSYGSEARGSACRSEVIISPKNIVYPHIRHADILGTMSQPGYDKFRTMLRGKDSYLIYDTSLVIAQEDASYIQRGFPATESAIKNLDKKVVANIIFLSAIVGWLKIVSPEALEKSVRNNVPAKYLDLNLKALEIGLELGRER